MSGKNREQNTYKTDLNRNEPLRPNICYIFEKLRVQGCQIWHSRVSHEFKESTMNPRFPSSALFWANFPESVLLTLGSHRSHKVAGASEDYDKKSGIPLTPPRSPWHPPDTRPKSNPWHPWDGDPWMLDQSPPNPPTTQIDILLTHLIRFVGKPLLPGKSGQE